jgi:hypothetical protein
LPDRFRDGKGCFGTALYGAMHRKSTSIRRRWEGKEIGRKAKGIGREAKGIRREAKGIGRKAKGIRSDI